MSITQSKYGRRFDEEFKREVAALASRPGAKQEQVARDLGVSPYSVSRWKKLYGSGPAVASPAGVNVAELERRIKALERENADLREQRARRADGTGVARLMRAHRLRATQEAALPAPHHRQSASLSRGTEPSGRARVTTDPPGRGVAGRHHLRCHAGGLALRGRGPRCLLAPGGGLGRRPRPCPPPWWPAPASAPCSDASPRAGLLHHSDRGSQYASDAYRELLRRHGVVPSMSRPANCDDHARMESFRATRKGELIGDHVCATRAEAKTALFDYIEVFYNRRRLHSALGYQSPVDYETNLS